MTNYELKVKAYLEAMPLNQNIKIIDLCTNKEDVGKLANALCEVIGRHSKGFKWSFDGITLKRNDSPLNQSFEDYVKGENLLSRENLQNQ